MSHQRVHDEKRREASRLEAIDIRSKETEKEERSNMVCYGLLLGWRPSLSSASQSLAMKPHNGFIIHGQYLAKEQQGSHPCHIRHTSMSPCCLSLPRFGHVASVAHVKEMNAVASAGDKPSVSFTRLPEHPHVKDSDML